MPEAEVLNFILPCLLYPWLFMTVMLQLLQNLLFFAHTVLCKSNAIYQRYLTRFYLKWYIKRYRCISLELLFYFLVRYCCHFARYRFLPEIYRFRLEIYHSSFAIYRFCLEIYHFHLARYRSSLSSQHCEIIVHFPKDNLR